MKTLYVIDYWVPFPDSEYGGLIVLIANNDEEAIRICVEEDLSFFKDFNEFIPKAVASAQKFQVVTEISGIVDHLLT